MELWIGGYPSFVGGADTELDHLIDLLRQHGVDVHLVPISSGDTTFLGDPKMRALCDERGCQTHGYRPNIFDDKVVGSFCNGEFLRRLPKIYAAGKPRAVLWFNCMTYHFPAEIEAHKRNHISRFGFQSQYQRNRLVPELRTHNEVVEFDGYRPFFNSESIAFHCPTPVDSFNLGRISRDDPAKFAEDTWRIFEKVSSPLPTKTFILGYSDKVEEKTGAPPPALDYMWWTANGIPVEEFYRRLHVIIHKTGGSRENWCRIVLEAAAYGVPVIAERDYGLREMIIDGETGFLCDSSDEMSYRASQLAFDEPLRQRIARNARDHLEGQLAGQARCWEPWRQLLGELS